MKLVLKRHRDNLPRREIKYLISSALSIESRIWQLKSNRTFFEKNENRDSREVDTENVTAYVGMIGNFPVPIVASQHDAERSFYRWNKEKSFEEVDTEINEEVIQLKNEQEDILKKLREHKKEVNKYFKHKIIFKKILQISLATMCVGIVASLLLPLINAIGGLITPNINNFFSSFNNTLNKIIGSVDISNSTEVLLIVSGILVGVGSFIGCGINYILLAGTKRDFYNINYLLEKEE